MLALSPVLFSPAPAHRRFLFLNHTLAAFGRADYFDDLVASVNDMTRGNDWFLLGACGNAAGSGWEGLEHTCGAA